MDKPIGVGDLVVVARPSLCIGGDDDIGLVFRVEQIVPGRETTAVPCFYCKKRHHLDSMYAGNDRFLYPFLRLKRIPPLDELESEWTETKLTESA